MRQGDPWDCAGEHPGNRRSGAIPPTTQGDDADTVEPQAGTQGDIRIGRGEDDERLVVLGGYEGPISEELRSEQLEEAMRIYLRRGFFVRLKTQTTAQLVKPKKFSFLWALLWLLLFGVGLIFYLFYFKAKKDEGAYLEVDAFGTVLATHQGRYVHYDR